MSTAREPLDWIIEVCVVCGCQLGPSIGSRTSSGRCIVPEHHSQGGCVVRVSAKPVAEQESSTVHYLDRLGLLAGRLSAGGEGE